MSAVRRLYFYGLALVSLEVVVWGVVGLLRLVLSFGLTNVMASLATGFSLVLVGIPIFFLHWRTIQREALGDPIERASRIRGIFLYGVLTVTLATTLYAVLALLNRGFAALLVLPEYDAWFGADQTASDNWTAIGINVLVLGYFWFVLKRDWLAQADDTSESYFTEVRRLYRYFWVLVGLTLLVAGTFFLLRYFLYMSVQSPAPIMSNLAGGLTLFLVGGPLWFYHWWVVQDSLYDPAERRSLLRLITLYLISLVGVIGVASAGGALITSTIRSIAGGSGPAGSFVQGNSIELGAAVPLAVMLIYYGRILKRENTAFLAQPRRATLRRLYFYILAFLGLAVMLNGMYSLVESLMQLAFVSPFTLLFWDDTLSGAVSAVLVGLPLWLVTWRRMQAEAESASDAGDQARRSILRKAYLYLVVFLLVIGAMAFSVQILNTLLSSLLSQLVPVNFGQNLAQTFLWLVIDLSFLIYHWRVLRRDSRLAQQTLGSRHAGFPTLVLMDGDLSFSAYLEDELNRAAPRLPIAVHPVEHGVPDEALLAVKALVMPVGLALEPPESLRLWLADFSGRRLLVPLTREGYTWLGQVEKSPQQLARETSHALRQMAEGNSPGQGLLASPWAITGYILGGQLGLLLLVGLFFLMNAIISDLFR